MKIIYKTFLFFSPILLFISCNRQDEKPKVFGIPEIIKPNQSDEILASSFLDSISYLALDSKTIIGEISNVIYHKMKFYIKDVITGTINVFDDKGFFLFKINGVGRGPGEYTEITDFYVTDKDIVILCRTLKKVIRYSLRGDFLDEQATGETYLDGVRPVKDGYITYSNEGNKYLIRGKQPGVSIQRKFKSKQVLSFEGYYAQHGMKQYQYLYEGIEGSYLLLSTSDTVFSYKDGVMRSKYAFDFGEKGISDKYRKLSSDVSNMDILKKKGFVVYKDYLVETENFVFLRFIQGSISYIEKLVYNKGDGKSIYAPYVTNDISLMPCGFPKFKKEKGQIISILTPGDFKNYSDILENKKQVFVENNKINEYNKLLEQFNKFSSNINPVLAIGYLK